MDLLGKHEPPPARRATAGTGAHNKRFETKAPSQGGIALGGFGGAGPTRESMPSGRRRDDGEMTARPEATSPRVARFARFVAATFVSASPDVPMILWPGRCPCLPPASPQPMPVRGDRLAPLSPRLVTLKRSSTVAPKALDRNRHPGGWESGSGPRAGGNPLEASPARAVRLTFSWDHGSLAVFCAPSTRDRERERACASMRT